ncbi:hypothetical protein FZEAL_5128 [Fusarium zealandicum]|uniref:Uncharacterized protein n=1 Tax=Fusarium zealandicum TaxID=1053134 RepID=A0A8H4UKC3_9HYPO|nr:hypothetical protein FZEAL_5128 [Fusarium zealandicum]
MPPDPLPLAANRAALSNRISLLLASQSSVLKNMTLTRPAPTSKRRAAPDSAENGDGDGDLLRGARPNEGVGYVPEKKDAQRVGNAKEERLLRGRTGKDGKQRKKADESESEEDVGRSALGKRKRPRREAEPEPEPAVQAQGEVEVEVEVEDEDRQGEPAKSDGDVDVQDAVEDDQNVKPSDATPKKKRKRKNKPKKKKTKSGNDGEE